MKNSWLSVACAALALTFVVQPRAVLAQQAPQNPGWFVPNQPRAAGPVGRSAAPTRAASPADTVPEPMAPVEESGAPPPQIQVQLPPPPEIPPIGKGPPTPSAIVGVVSIPDALRVSTAFQTADKVFNERWTKLRADQRNEDVALRELQQQYLNERAKLTPEQVHQKELELQNRNAEDRRKFGERSRIIQEAGQYVMAQINRTMEQVVQLVAQSRGINVVLNRAQVLGTTADFDLTPQVAEVLNKVLPAVVIPPDGVSPVSMTPPKAEPGGAPEPVASAKPALPAKAAASAPAKH